MDAADLQYNLMQRAQYENINGDNDEDLANHIVGCFEEHEKYPYEQFLFEHLPTDKSEMLALDFGCGPGRMIKRMGWQFKRIDGADISMQCLRGASRWTAQMPNRPALFHVDGMVLNNVPSNAYDFVFSVIAFHHIASYNIRMSLLAEMLRVLKPGGRLSIQFFYTTQPRGEWPHHADWRESIPNAGRTNGWHDVRITPDNLALVKEDLEKLGYTDVSHTMAPYPPPPHPRESATDWVFINAKKP